MIATREVVTLTETDVRSLVGPPEALAAMRAAFAALQRGEVTQPAIMDFEFAQVGGEAHLKGAHIHALPVWSVKAAAGFSANRERGLPVNNGLSLVFSAETGVLIAILFDNGYLTELRTGAAGALAADLLAAEQIEQVAIVGAGSQSRYQLQALLGVRQPGRVVVASRSRSGAEEYAREMRTLYEIDVGVAPDIESAVRESQLIVTTTPARSPLVRADWLQPGTHLTAIGSDFPDKQELEVAVLARADIVAVDDPAVAAGNGELHHALDAGAIRLEDIVTLGALLTGDAEGRRSDDDVTVADLCGVGVQDAAIASEVVRSAVEAGVGNVIAV